MIHQATRSRHLLPALALTVLFPVVAWATSFSWTSTGGEFNAAANWTQSGAPVDADGIPDANDTATFDRGNVTLYPVYFGNLLVPNSDIHPTVDRVVIGNNPLNFVGLYGSTLTVDNGNITETARGVVIGSDAGDVAALTSTLATFDTQYATLGSAAGSSGTLNLTSSSAGAFSVSGTGATYDLIVGLNGTGAINVSNGRDVTVADDTILGKNATGVGNVSVSGSGSTWTNTGDLTVGGTGSGEINLSDHVQLSNAAGYLGNDAGSTGTATVIDGSTWTNTGDLTVGGAGSGTLSISGFNYSSYLSSGAGTIGRSATGVGQVNIGVRSDWINTGNLYVGDLGDGTLNVSSGGYVSNVNGYIGYAAGSTGNVGVSDFNGRLPYWENSGDLYVGYSGHGTLGIYNAGQVTNDAGHIGYAAGSSGMVVVSGLNAVASTWRNDGILYVGELGDGMLEVNDRAQLFNATSYIGYGADSISTARVVGGYWISGPLYVGYSGHGALEVIGGIGYVTSSGDGYIGYNTGSVGSITVDGLSTDSAWKLAVNTLYVGFGGSGSLMIKNNARVQTTIAIVGSLGDIHGNGSILGSVQNGGIVAPGTSPGTLTITGNYSQTTAGILQIELASLVSLDKLAISGNATLAGTLEVSLIGGYAPLLGQSFDILDWGGTLTGTFATLNLPGLTADLVWNTTALYTSGVISVVLPGDYNANGIVDAADYVVWRKNDGTPAGYNTWRANFGQTAGSGSGTSANAAVPEPATLAMLMFAAAALCLRRGRFT